MDNLRSWPEEGAANCQKPSDSMRPIGSGGEGGASISPNKENTSHSQDQPHGNSDWGGDDREKVQDSSMNPPRKE